MRLGQKLRKHIQTEIVQESPSHSTSHILSVTLRTTVRLIQSHHNLGVDLGTEGIPVVMLELTTLRRLQKLTVRTISTDLRHFVCKNVTIGT